MENVGKTFRTSYISHMKVMFIEAFSQGGSDGSGRHSAAPMLTAIMSGGVGICGRVVVELMS